MTATKFKPNTPQKVNWSHQATRGLIGCWTWGVNEWSTPDLSGRTNPAVGSGTPTLVSGNYFGGKAIHFDGSSRADVTATSAMNTGTQITVETWIKGTTVDAAQGLVIRDDEGTNRCYHIRGNGGAVQLVSFPSVVNFTGAVAVNDGLWHQVVMTLGDGSLRLYIDGKADGSTACTDTHPTTTIATTFGAFTDGVNKWTGDMWMTRIWNRCLSAVEIRQLFHAPTDMFIAPVHKRFYEMPAAAGGGGGLPDGARYMRAQTQADADGALLRF